MNSGVSYARLDPDTEERFVSLRRDLGVTSFGLNQILLRPGQRGRIHRHTTQEEVYLVLAGTLSLWIEGEEKRLGQGEWRGSAPRCAARSPTAATRTCCCSRSAAHGEHVGRDGEAFESWEQQTRRAAAGGPATRRRAMIEHVGQITLEQYDEIEAGEQDPFGLDDEDIEWIGKTHQTLLRREDGR